MKFFLSWSGELSRQIAEVLRAWFPSVLQSAKPFFTPNDIDKGARWNSEIASNLQNSSIGIFVITKENLDKPWIMFEAGAISRELTHNKVCVVLFGVDPTDLVGPLTQFQATRFNKADFRKLIDNMNDSLGEMKLEQTTLTNVFEKWWPDLQSQVDIIQESSKVPHKTKKGRDERDMIEEVLNISRAVQKDLNEKLDMSYVSLSSVLLPDALVRTLTAVYSMPIQGNRKISNYENILRGLIEEIKTFPASTPYRNKTLEKLNTLVADLVQQRRQAPNYDLDDDIPF